jgi:hypothetical protein
LGSPSPCRTTFGQTEWIHETNAVVGPRLGQPGARALPVSAYDSALWSFLTMATDAGAWLPDAQAGQCGASTAPVCRYLHTHVYEDDRFFEQFNGGTVFSTAPRCGVGAVDTSI